MSDKKKQKSSEPIYTSMIIGAGRIAALFDHPHDANVLTHAHGFLSHPRTSLIGFVDENAKQAKQAAKRWGVQAFSDLSSTLDTCRPDIVSICTPDETHAQILLNVLQYRPKLVICEKPLVSTQRDLVKIRNAYQIAEVPMLVNYTRRFDTTMQHLRRDLLKGVYGSVVSVHGIYDKGLLHNGSHMVDLCRYLFGPIRSTRALSAIHDYTDTDPTVGAWMRTDICNQIFLSANDQRNFSVFELDIICSRARIRLLDGGWTLSVERRIADPVYKGYTTLGEPVVTKTQLPVAMAALIENAVSYLDGRVELLCDLTEASETLSICFPLHTQAKHL